MVEWCKEFLKTWHIDGTLLVQQKWRLVRRTKPFTLQNGELYKMGQDNRLWWCLTTIEVDMVMRELHEGPSGGHFTTKIT
jgi:hypothetical protein